MENKEQIEDQNEQQPKRQSSGSEIEINPKRNVNSKVKRKVYVANILTFVIIAFGFYWLIVKYFHIGDKNYTESAQVEEFINPINTRISAYIKEIRFTEHQKVKKGDTLVILDDREILTQLGQAEAAYMAALASKNMTSSAVNTVSTNVNVVGSNIEGAKARLWNVEQNMKRYKNLLETEAVTQQQYDQIKTEYEATKASYEALLNQKSTTQSAVSEAQSRLYLNEADIKRTEAALNMAKLNLSYTVITAPYDGVMGRRLINEGQLLQPGQQVTTIVLNDQKWVTANFLESQMPKIDIGTKIKMSADALGGQEFEGEITAISAATGARYSSVPVDNSTGNFVKVQQRIPVRIEFTDANKKEDVAKLKAGMNVVIRIN